MEAFEEKSRPEPSARQSWEAIVFAHLVPESYVLQEFPDGVRLLLVDGTPDVTPDVTIRHRSTKYLAEPGKLGEIELAQAYVRGDLEVDDEGLPKLLGIILSTLQEETLEVAAARNELYTAEYLPEGVWRDLLVIPNIYDVTRIFSARIKKTIQEILLNANIASVNCRMPLAEKLIDKLNIAFHYDLPQTVYDLMLGDPDSNGEETAYTCAYLGDPKKINRPCEEQDVEPMTLTKGQSNKFELNARKLGLHRPAEEGEKEKLDILDVGCGSASEIIYYVTNFRERIGKVVGITLSKRQLEEGRRKVEEAGLSDVIELRYQNYQDLDQSEKFDRVLSVGMAEAVGIDHLGDYAQKINDVMSDEGRGLIHLITTNRGVEGTPGEKMGQNSSFISTRIFPGGQLPTVAEIKEALGNAGLTIEHEHQFGFYYYETTRRWFKNWCDREFEIIKALQEDGQLSPKKAVKKHREYKLYLAGVSQMFLQRVIDLTQLTVNKNGSQKDDSAMEEWMAA